MVENPGMNMSKRLLPLALASLLLPAAGWAQESQPPSTETKPAEAQPAPEPEKKPDAFQYFFGKKREEKNGTKKAPEAQKVPEAPKPTPAAPKAAPEKPAPPAVEAPPVHAAPAPAPASEVRPEPPTVAAPEVAPPAVLAPAPEEPQVSAFQYFFGHATEPLPEIKKEEAPKTPATAFEYFFGKNGKADEPEPTSPPPQ